MENLINGKGKHFNKSGLEQPEWGVKYTDKITGVINIDTFNWYFNGDLEIGKSYDIIVNGVVYKNIIATGQEEDIVYVADYIDETHTDYSWIISCKLNQDGGYFDGTKYSFSYSNEDHNEEEISIYISGIKQEKIYPIDFNYLPISQISLDLTSIEWKQVEGKDIYHGILVDSDLSNFLSNNLFVPPFYFTSDILGQPYRVYDNSLHFIDTDLNFDVNEELISEECKVSYYYLEIIPEEEEES